MKSQNKLCGQYNYNKPNEPGKPVIWNRYNKDTNMKTYSAYFFDMDGTLVNSEKYKGMALSKTCMKFGGQADINTYKAVMGESRSIVTNHFFKAVQIAPGLNEFNSEFQKHLF